MQTKLSISNPAGAPGRRTVRAMTLVEMMVAMAVGFLILAVLAQVFMSSAFSFAAMCNYVSLGTHSRQTLDHLTREIRQAGNLVEFSPSRLKFSLQGQTNAFLVYAWDAQSRQLTESRSGDPQPKVLLTDCEQLAFSMRDGVFAPTTEVARGKGIRVTWRCSRTLAGRPTTSEDMEQALIIMRNKPV